MCHQIFTLSLAVAVLTAAGCGAGPDDAPLRAPVTGTVTLDNQPLPSGVIRFVPEGTTTGPQASASITDGTFQLPEELGPVVGSHRVEIESTDDGGLAFDDEEAVQRLQASGRKRVQVFRIPPVYNRQSQLRADIDAEAPNQLTFELYTADR